ncbi:MULTISPECIES: asparaginase domain-containing protein [Methylomicrobium]|uniref:L-asparaginase/GlutRNAGln amidotransferase subunit D n=1 Tax=Methylomicrobium album BG8 TaxID=686340 RepID=H8GND0_METAL|nr:MULTISPECIES: asparaginase domain-containing protein [Methylomicrobium]EIC28359.1 L-asparaginase/GlutRNAGln amidotransferase subunit D [Methylomicrobium album BG8]
MKQILVVFTGGTIGSAASEGTIKPSEAAPFKLLGEFRRRFPEMAKEIGFDSIEPIRLLSENLAPAAWPIIIEAIEAKQPERYDGVIVTHGTDTLAYTAAALAFYFRGLKVPLLLVSSDHPLDHPQANGPDNFRCAVDFILDVKEPGVFVPYRNRGQAMQVHRGARLASSLQLSGDFFSVQGQSYLEYRDGRFLSQSLPALSARAEMAGVKARFSDRILIIRPYPGLDYTHFSLNGVEAVLHDLYHSGTACSTRQWGENHSLPAFIKRCRQQGVKVYLAPARKSPDAYESTRFLLDAGAEMIWNMSIEAAYVKLALAYGNFQEPQDITAFLAVDMAGEFVD